MNAIRILAVFLGKESDFLSGLLQTSSVCLWEVPQSSVIEPPLCWRLMEVVLVGSFAALPGFFVLCCNSS